MIKITNKSLSPQPHQHKKIDTVSATECANCGTTTTPLWRRGSNGETICNACGLYLKARNTLRPPTLKRTVHKKATPEPKNGCGSGGTCPGGGQCNGTGGSSSCAGCPAFNQHQINRQALICANCRTTTTPLWRRDEQGNTICNACGLYYKLHNVHRPVSMKRSVIKRRKRIIVAQGSDEEGLEDEKDMPSPSPSPAPASVSVSTPILTPTPVPVQLPVQVPEIEDYVILKKKKIELPLKKQHTINSSSDNTPLFSKPYPDHQPVNKSYLPPISAERQSYRLESLFGRRESNSSTVTSSSTGTTLPPLSLPPLTPPLSQQLQHQQRPNFNSPPSIPTQQPSPPANIHIPSNHGGYELADFDMALDRLEHLRRQVRPEQAYALSQLTQSITDLASKAEAILSLDSLAYGR
ncbi:hypothetical protein INT48_000355 [Thamnidium elegans]|uniref:GATA-type domain-containing protein n=1 Tax=Thamnidium elegans TaxID=101142 RepID=A0A8H7SVK6_9FUNG|nr:hypothetical protein INT48_000355 [Thamnidium elegans]